MTSADVTSKIQELTTPATGDSAFVYGLVLPAKKGSYEPYIVTGINSLKDRYTPKGLFYPNIDKAFYAAKKFCDIGSVQLVVVRPDLGEKFGGLECKSVSNTVTFAPAPVQGQVMAIGSTVTFNNNGYVFTNVTTIPATGISTTVVNENCMDIGSGLEINVPVNFNSSLTIAKGTKLFMTEDPLDAEFSGITSYPFYFGTQILEDAGANMAFFGWYQNSEDSDLVFGYFHKEVDSGEESFEFYVTDLVAQVDVDNCYIVASDISSISTDFWTSSEGDITTSYIEGIKYALVNETFENIIEDNDFQPLKDYGESYTIGETLYYENVPYLCKKVTTVPSYVTQTWINNNFNPVGLSLDETQGLVGWDEGRRGSMDNYIFSDNEVMVFYGANGGEWTNHVSVSIVNYLDNPKEIQIPEAFQVKVYYYGVLQDTYICSRVQGILDANGESIYVEDVINSRSINLRVKDNTAIPADINPATCKSPVDLAGGADGGNVNDDAMIAALNKLSNESRYPITIMGNGGYATVDYAKALNTFMSARRSGVVSFSLPLTAVLSHDPISAYEEFVDQVGISDPRFWFEEFWSMERDSDTGRNVYIPADGLMANIYGNLIVDQGLYYAPAGWINAMCNGVIPVNQWDKGSRDRLDLDKINFFKKSSLGLCVFSEATSLARPSYLQQKHIVIALYDLIPRVEDAMEPFLFQLADEATYLRITKAIEPIMELFTMNKGCAVNPRYKITCDTTNNSQAMRDAQECAVWIEYTPLNSIKHIKITFGLTNGSVSLADITEV